MQYRHQHERDRLLEVEGLRGLFEDPRGLLEVRVDVVRLSLGPTGEQRTRVSEHNGVVVDVHDPRLRSDPLRDLVDVLLRRQPCTDVQELADARFPGQRGDRSAQEVPVVPDVEVPRGLATIAAAAADRSTG